MFVDGSSNETGSGASLILQGPEGIVIERFSFKASNNEAEYESLISDLKLVKSLKVDNLVAHSDSQLVVRQMTREYEVNDPRMVKYFEKTKSLINSFFYEFPGLKSRISLSIGFSKPYRGDQDGFY